MNSAYYGKNIRFEFRFVNNLDLTEYQVWRQAGADGPKNMIYIGHGHRNANSTFASLFTINAAGWTGTPNLNDLIIMITDSNMSIDDAEATMNDIEAQIDDVLRQEAIIAEYPEGTIPTDLYFVVNAPVPRQIRVAAAYAFCYRAINDLFKAGRSLKLPSGKEEMTDEDFALAYQWQKVSEKSLKDYIKTYLVQNAGNAPRWSGWKPLQSTIGISGQLNGKVYEGTDEDYLDEDNMLDTAGKIEDALNSSNAG